MEAKLPIYDAFIDDEADGITTISLVDMPAVEHNFLCFKDEKTYKFAVQSEEERIISGVLMLADTPIFRRDKDGTEYYLKFGKDTIKSMAIKMLKDKTFNNFSFQHNGILLPEGTLEMVEIFIKDDEKGINTLFNDIPNGSLCGSFKVNDDDIWEECKNGNYLNGFSIEVVTSVRREDNQFKNNLFKSMKNKFKEVVKSLMMLFGMVDTDNGTLHYDGEEDLVAGMEVYDENGEPKADGEYKTNDGKVITVKDGKVESITDPIAEVEPVEEEKPVEMACGKKKKMEEVPVEEVTEIVDEPTVDYIAEIEALKAEIEKIKKTLEELACKPTAEPIVEEFNKVNESNKFAELGKALANIRK